MLEPIPFAGYVEIDESFDRTASHMANQYVSYNEPVAWGMLDSEGGIYDSISPAEHDREEGAYTIPLYTQPSKDLTDDEIAEIFDTTFKVRDYEDSFIKFARAILKRAQEK